MIVVKIRVSCQTSSTQPFVLAFDRAWYDFMEYLTHVGLMRGDAQYSKTDPTIGPRSTALPL